MLVAMVRRLLNKLFQPSWISYSGLRARWRTLYWSRLARRVCEAIVGRLRSTSVSADAGNFSAWCSLEFGTARSGIRLRLCWASSACWICPNGNTGREGWGRWRLCRSRWCANWPNLNGGLHNQADCAEGCGIFRCPVEVGGGEYAPHLLVSYIVALFLCLDYALPAVRRCLVLPYGVSSQACLLVRRLMLDFGWCRSPLYLASLVNDSVLVRWCAIVSSSADLPLLLWVRWVLIIFLCLYLAGIGLGSSGLPDDANERRVFRLEGCWSVGFWHQTVFLLRWSINANVATDTVTVKAAARTAKSGANIDAFNKRQAPQPICANS